MRMSGYTGGLPSAMLGPECYGTLETHGNVRGVFRRSAWHGT